MLTLKSLVPNRRWLRFSLATFLLAVAVIAYGCKWVLDRVNLCAGQYDLLVGISNVPENFRQVSPPVPGPLGAGPGSPGRHPGKHVSAFGYSFAIPTGWEKTVADWLGINYEVDVVTLSFRGPSQDVAKDIEVVARLPKLKGFSLQGEPITKDVIAAIKSMKGLESLVLVRAEISDHDDLNALEGMNGLRSLDFHRTDLNEGEAAALKRALPLTHIRVWGEVRVNGQREIVAVIDLP